MAGQEDPLARRGNPLARLGEPADGDSEATQADLPEPEAARDARHGRAHAGSDRTERRSTPQDLHASGSAGEVLAVYSPKGGVGTSLLTSQLASAAAAFSQLHTVLVDLNPPGAMPRPWSGSASPAQSLSSSCPGRRPSPVARATGRGHARRPGGFGTNAA